MNEAQKGELIDTENKWQIHPAPVVFVSVSTVDIEDLRVPSIYLCVWTWACTVEAGLELVCLKAGWTRVFSGISHNSEHQTNTCSWDLA